jgi:peptidoglycan/LPS O-acetylase OafA/YrhL
VLVYAILAMVLRKKAVIDLGLCPVHRARRSRWGWITGGICALGVAMFVGAGFLFQERTTEDYGALAIVAGILTLLVAAVVGSIAMRVLKPTKIDDRFGWFKGAGPEFLASLPPAR